MKQICKFCKSEIDNECYKCPICREWIHPYKLSKDNPFLKRLVGSLIILTLVVFTLRYISSNYIFPNFEIKTFQSAEEHRLKILWSNVSEVGKKKIILGELKNGGVDSFSSVEIEAYFYDKDKKLIRIGSAYISGNIKPGDVRPFQIFYSAECSLDTSIKEFESYELKIINGYINKAKK